ncbi:helix-turn-helix domain-containing protein [Oceanotoga teriensis]|jgi:AraC-like DNA-binding protein|uniref:helix-turn-helix domain-containing protein n=1 Tax=Oceanotoga teriensis TaxID=515440 RepID=UPI00271223E6|nr:response regulator transcription factor [Oceanotoga teriensis]MDO7976529.1 helix-turn-helix transcriptional regulator [Oceanotoga teriensis]
MYKDTSHLLNKVKNDTITKFLNICDFSINGFGKWIPRHQKIINNTMIGDFEIAFFITGKANLTIYNKLYICEENAAFIIPPFTVYTAEWLNKDLKYYYIHFDIKPPYLEDDFKKIILMNNINVLNLNKNYYKDLFENIYQNSRKKTAGYTIEIKSLLNLIIVDMIKNNLKEKKLTTYIDKYLNPSTEMKIVNKAVEIINSKENIFPKISDISYQLNISENYLYKSFMKILKLPPSKYIMYNKIKKSEKMLCCMNYSIQEISDKLGFSSLSHFSKAFKTYFNESPKKYLENKQR